MKRVLLATSILAAAMSANAAVVINEFLYDPAGTDTGEYIELYNNGAAPVDISGWTVNPVNGAGGAAYSIITIPAATNLAAGDYYVIGSAATINASYPGVVDQDFSLNNILQNGAPDAIVLRDAGAVKVDAVNYEADGAFTLAGPFETEARSEGGVGRTVSRLITDTTQAVTTGRLPNGVDTDSNEADFANIAATPGAANVDSVTLPFTDSFSTVDPAWRYSFITTRVVDPTAVNKPGVVSPDGGNVMEVGDSTGGGDTIFLPAALSTINVEGYIWIPPDDALAPWSIGVGIGERNNCNWFSPTVGNGMENGYYLEYENGPVTGNKACLPGAGSAAARLIAVNSTPTLNTNATTASVGTVLGTTTSVNKGAWNTFRIGMTTGRVYASINGTVIYDGVQVAGSSTDGGVILGFRESHTGNPDPAKAEFLYLDGLAVNTNLPAASVSDWTMMNE